MTRRLGVLLLGLTLGSGCTLRALCPEDGGEPWREVSSPHFRVRTNLGTKASLRAARELELLRRALTPVWGADFNPPGTLEVIVLRNPRQFREFTTAYVDGISGTTPDGPVMVLAGASYLVESPGSLSTQAHELAHHLARYAQVRQPRWLSEGLATYLETVILQPEEHQAFLNEIHLRNYLYTRRHGWLSVDELWDWDQRGLLSAADSEAHYASAWLWVHFLINAHGDRFMDFQDRLVRGEEPRRAWAEAMAGVKDLAGQLRYYGGTLERIRVPLPPVSTGFEEQPLDCAEVHATRARLFLMAPGRTPPEERRKKAEAEVAQALEKDPTNVTANVLRARTVEDPARRLALARRLTEQHPDSGAAWELLAQALDGAGDTSEAQAHAWRQAIDLRPDSVTALQGHANHAARTGRPEAGGESSERALRLAPGDPVVLGTRAAVLFGLGQCPEALSTQALALELLTEAVPRRKRQELLDAFTRYKARCGPPAPAPQ